MAISWADCGTGCFTTDYCVRAVIRNGDASASSTSQYEFSVGGELGQYAWNQTAGKINSGDRDVLLNVLEGGGAGNINLTLDTHTVDGDGTTYGNIVKVVLEAAVSTAAGDVTWTEVVVTFYNAGGVGAPTDPESFTVPTRGSTYRRVAVAPDNTVRVKVQGKIRLNQSAASLSLNALAGRIYVYTTGCSLFA